jgi:hypothetical protein
MAIVLYPGNNERWVNEQLVIRTDEHENALVPQRQRVWLGPQIHKCVRDVWDALFDTACAVDQISDEVLIDARHLDAMSPEWRERVCTIAEIVSAEVPSCRVAGTSFRLA